jgi:hypothetical protein
LGVLHGRHHGQLKRPNGLGHLQKLEIWSQVNFCSQSRLGQGLESVFFYDFFNNFLEKEIPE